MLRFDKQQLVTEHSVRRGVLVEQARLHHVKLAVALLVAALSAATIVMAMWTAVPRAHVVGWLTALIVASVGHAMMVWLYTNRPRSARAGHLDQGAVAGAPPWAKRFVVGAGTNGVVWGSAGLLLFPPASATHQMLIVLAIAAMTACAAQSAAGHMAAFGAFALPALAPVVLRLLAQATAGHFAMASMLVLFGAAMALVARAGGRTQATALRSRMHNALSLRRLWALRRQRDFAEDLIEAAPVIVLVVDREDRIVRFNSYFELVTGCPLKQVKGRDWISLVVPGDRQRQCRLDLGRAASNGGALLRTCSIVGSGGDERQIEWYGTSLRDGPVGTPLTLYIGQDVTDRNRLQVELIHSQKMDALGKLAGGVAHDFNNLLLGVRGCGGRAIELLGEGSPALPFLQEIVRAVERRISLTRQLLDFSCKRPFEARTIGVAAVVEDSEVLLRQLLGAKIELQMEVTDTTATIRADPAQIEQILMNVASNARDAMRGGGTLTISVGHVAGTKTANARSRMPQGWVCLRMSDTGRGMAPEIISRIFDPFFTTKDVGEGTGLGLSTVYGLIKDLGGKVAVESEIGRGTTMTMCFPPAAADERIAEMFDGDAGMLSKSRADTVLLVDDEDLLRITLKEYLEDLGYNVLLASHPNDAVEVSTRHAGPIQLLLTGMALPGMDGLRLAQRLRALYPDLDVIYISAQSADVLRRQGQVDSRSTVLQKPFDKEMLARTIRSVLRH